MSKNQKRHQRAIRAEIIKHKSRTPRAERRARRKREDATKREYRPYLSCSRSRPRVSPDLVMVAAIAASPIPANDAIQLLLGVATGRFTSNPPQF